MPTTLTATVRGASTSLSDGTLCWREGEDGTGVPPNHRLTERGPNQQGGTDRGFRLDPRLITLLLGMAGTDEADMYNKRSQLLALFAPKNDPVTLTWALPNGMTYQIDTFYRAQMTLGSQDRQGFYQKVGVQLQAPDPTFYNPAGNLFTFGVGGGAGSGFTIPMTMPIGVGQSTLSGVRTITYAGTFRAYPLISITGPITSPVITNLSTGELLDFTGLIIGAGEVYIIDASYEAKTVTLNGADKIFTLSTASNLSTWHIASSDEVPSGINDIQMIGTGISSATEVRMTWNDRYIGF